MTYAMTLDNSWEIMDEEEMYDVNGGFWGNGISTFWTGIAIDAAITVAGIGFAASGFLKALAMKKAGRVYIRTSMKSFLIAAGFKLTASVNAALYMAASFLSNVSSIGSLVANVLDFADGNYNGYIKF